MIAKLLLQSSPELWEYQAKAADVLTVQCGDREQNSNRRDLRAENGVVSNRDWLWWTFMVGSPLQNVEAFAIELF